MKKTIAVIAAAIVIASTTAADAHRTRWFWSEKKADARLENSYSDVRRADCLGFGPTKRTRAGRRYSHFSCGLRLTDGTGMTVTVEVLGRRKARVLYNDGTDIIR